MRDQLDVHREKERTTGPRGRGQPVQPRWTADHKNDEDDVELRKPIHDDVHDDEHVSRW